MPTALDNTGSQERSDKQGDSVNASQESPGKKEETVTGSEDGLDNQPEDETASSDKRTGQQRSEKAQLQAFCALQTCFSLAMDGNMAVLKPDCFGGANCLPKNIEEDTQWLSRNYLMYAHIDPKQRVEGRRDQVFRSEDLREASVWL